MITVDKLSKTYHTSTPRRALHEVSLDIEAGALYGLLGPQGSGKSTLARLISLRDRPDTGAVRVDGVNTARLNDRSYRELRGRFHTVDPDAVLLPERTAAGNIAAPLERLGVHGPQRRELVGEALDLVGLTPAATTLLASLTEGQRRRVALARALVLQPTLLLVDDLTDGLDSAQAGGVLAAVDRARAELGVTVVLATRSADVVRKVCDHVAVLADGHLLESGAVLELLSDQDSHTARGLLPAVDTADTWLDGYDRIADVVLIGHSTVNTLVPEAGARVGVEINTVGGGTTRIGDTPIARYRLGLRGERADLALGWIGEHGGQVRVVVRHTSRITARTARATRELAGAAA